MGSMRRRPLLNATVRVRIDELVGGATHAHAIGDRHDAWRQLEDAHVLSQPWVRPHLRVHAKMLHLAWRERDGREVLGQISRIVLAGPGSATGRYPAGNTGRSRVSAFEPMPIRSDLATILDTASGVSSSEAGRARR